MYCIEYRLHYSAVENIRNDRHERIEYISIRCQASRGTQKERGQTKTTYPEHPDLRLNDSRVVSFAKYKYRHSTEIMELCVMHISQSQNPIPCSMMNFD